MSGFGVGGPAEGEVKETVGETEGYLERIFGDVRGWGKKLADLGGRVGEAALLYR